MRLLERIRARPLVAIMGAALLVGSLLGLAWPVEVPPLAGEPADRWTPPAALASLRPLEKEFSAVRDAAVWGGQETRSGGVKSANWVLVGIISDPEPAVLVLEKGKTQAQRIRVGGALPDTGVVREILADGFRYERAGCIYARALYAVGEIAEGDCAAPPAVNPGNKTR